MELTFFPKQSDWRKWLQKNHEKETEILVGFYKKGTGKESIDWPQSVDEALCFGWIDGVRRGVDEDTYSIRFTPRKPSSIWSAVNIKKVEELKEQGLMKPAGLAAYERRKEHKSKIYSFEQGEIALGAENEKLFKKNKKAWDNFNKMPAGYRKQVTWYVINAKQEATKTKRLQALIENSEANERLPHLRLIKKVWPKKEDQDNS